MPRPDPHEAEAVRDALRELLRTIEGVERERLVAFLAAGPTFGQVRAFVDQAIRRLEATQRASLN